MNIFECNPRDYHAKLKCNRANVLDPDSYLSKSVLWELDSSSLYKWRFHETPRKITDAMRWGSLIDCMTTTSELFASEYAVLPSDAPQRPTEAMMKAAKPSQTSIDRQTWWAQFDLQSEGREVIEQDWHLRAIAAKKMLTETCKASADIFAKSKSQVIVAGNVLGAKVKGLIDLAPEGEDFLADLKTVSTFSLEGFAKATANFGYHVQAGIYLNLWNSQHPNDQRTRWKLIWQDSAAPYEACVTELAPQDIEAGWAYAVTLIQRILDATAADSWPLAFSDKESITTRPTWAAMQEETKITA